MTPSSRFASLDIGSNTVRLLIAEKAAPKSFRALVLERRITRLGGQFSLQGYLAESSIRRTIEAISDFARLGKNWGVERIFAVATGVVRSAQNKTLFLNRVREETGISPRLISGQEEARLTLQGVLSSLTDEILSALVIDIGGWSTEILWVEKGNLKKAVSTELGAVSLAERFFKADPPSDWEIGCLDDQVRHGLQDIRRDLQKAGWEEKLPSSHLVGTAGTITTLAAIDLEMKIYDPAKINHHRLSRSRIEDIFSRLAVLRIKERRLVPGLEEGREDLILSGTRVVLKTMEVFHLDPLTVIDSGLLEGVLLEGMEMDNSQIKPQNPK